MEMEDTKETKEY